jgi:hypothetical protein
MSNFQHKGSVVPYRGVNVFMASVSAAGFLAMINWGFYYIVNK